MRIYGKYTKLKSTVIFGGVGINPQIDASARAASTSSSPRRAACSTTWSSATVDLSQVEILVLDEADRMLDMGFIHDIKQHARRCCRRSARTCCSRPRSRTRSRPSPTACSNKPALIEVARRNSTVEVIAQNDPPGRSRQKRELLAHLIKTQQLVPGAGVHAHQARRQQAGRTAGRATASARSPFTATRASRPRTRALAEFKDNKLQVLVATDIAARGIDIDQLPHVVNYDLPNIPEDYVHRIGRTGRAGATARRSRWSASTSTSC